MVRWLKPLAVLLLATLTVSILGSAYGNPVVFHTGFEYSSQPTNLAAMPTHWYVDLTWEPPLDTYGHSISSYLVYRSDGSHPYPERTTLLATLDAATRSYRDQTVVDGKEYTYYVVAKASDGATSPSSNYVAVIVGSTTPSEPNYLRAVPMDGSVELLWITPDNPGGVYFTSYRVYRTSIDDNWTMIREIEANTFTEPDVIDSGLTNGLNYTYSVRAVNVFGEGDGATVEVTPNYAPTSIRFSPSDVSADFGDSSKQLTFYISWNPASDLSSITHYAVYVQQYGAFPEEGMDVGLNTSFVLNGTVSGLAHSSIRVAAVYANGSESFSERAYVPVYLPVDGPIGGFWESVFLLVIPFLFIAGAIVFLVMRSRKQSR